MKYIDYDCDEEEVAFALTVSEMMYAEEPKNMSEARVSPEWDKWNAADDDEMESLQKNETWVLVKKPENRKIISNKQLFNIKPGIEGLEPDRHKVRLVARGFT